MVGLVIVSHSATLAGGVVELARQMGAGEVAIEAAGGMAEPEGAIGTDVELVRAAIDRAAGPDGVLVLMDLGSAVMSAEMAAELIAMESAVEVLLSEAPLVEGAVAAAARAGAGAPLAEVAAEASAALAMKASQLGIEPAVSAPAPTAATDGPEPGGPEIRLEVGNALGLHARPAARIVETAARFDAEIRVRDETSGRGPADARSLTGVVTLGARLGHTLVVSASGPQEEAALAALGELAATGFGDGIEPAPGTPAAAALEPAIAGRGTAGPGTAGLGTAGPSTAGPGTAADLDAPLPPVPALAPLAPGATLRGIPVAVGIAIGPARPPRAAAAVVVEETAAGDPAAERARLDEARAGARGEVEGSRERIATQAGEAEAAIFDAHLLLLEDAALLGPAAAAIEGGASAGRAWRDAVVAVAQAYRALDDPYLRERAADVEDVGATVSRHLGGQSGTVAPRERGILLVADLSPGDAAALDRDLVEGLAIAHGGATSHAAILARALGIPSVVGLGDGVLAIADGTPLVLDGGAGTLEVDPPAGALADRVEARERVEVRRRRARSRASEPATTRDGTTIEVAANVGAASEVPGAIELGADGIGLLRTEFLFLNRAQAPTEAEQHEAYEAIATALAGRLLIVRTLDAGADKPLAFLAQDPEENPFLGKRGIRLALAHPELLSAQLRAIMRLAGAHPVRVMFPMVATLAEYRAARALAEAARAAVGAPPVPIGVMVEVPAVALAAERFAREVDFFSIGTNDLTQYTMAADRGNPALADLLGGPLPPVLALVAAVTAGAAAHDRWVGVCGELAGDPAAAVLLAGLGVRELSAAPTRIPDVKQALREIDLREAGEVARRALELDDAAAVSALVTQLQGSAERADQ